jgi:RNA polymerase sigma-70 factor, ECF subfamily
VLDRERARGEVARFSGCGPAADRKSASVQVVPSPKQERCLRDHVDVSNARVRALEEVYRLRYPHFVRVSTAIVGNEDAAHDAVQEAFASALRHRRAFRGDGPLEAWVWRIVINEARKRRSRGATLAVGKEPEAPTNGAHPDSDALRSWIAGLPERQRLSIFLRYYADLDYRSIAEALGVEVGTVSATLSTAHAALRKRLEEVER